MSILALALEVSLRLTLVTSLVSSCSTLSLIALATQDFLLPFERGVCEACPCLMSSHYCPFFLDILSSYEHSLLFFSSFVHFLMSLFPVSLFLSVVCVPQLRPSPTP